MTKLIKVERLVNSTKGTSFKVSGHQLMVESVCEDGKIRFFPCSLSYRACHVLNLPWYSHFGEEEEETDVLQFVLLLTIKGRGVNQRNFVQTVFYNRPYKKIDPETMEKLKKEVFQRLHIEH